MRFAKGDTFLDLCRRDRNHAALAAPCRCWLARTDGATVQGTPPSSRNFMVNHCTVGGAYRKRPASHQWQSSALRLSGPHGRLCAAARHAAASRPKHGDLNGLNW